MAVDAYELGIYDIDAYGQIVGIDPAGHKKAITDRFTANLNPVAAIMQEGIERGVIIDEDPVQLAFYFVSLIQGLTLQRPPDYEVPVDMNVDAMIRLFVVKENHKSSSKKMLTKHGPYCKISNITNRILIRLVKADNKWTDRPDDWRFNVRVE